MKTGPRVPDKKPCRQALQDNASFMYLEVMEKRIPYQKHPLPHPLRREDGFQIPWKRPLMDSGKQKGLARCV